MLFGPFLARRWRADDGPILVVFGSTHHLKKQKKNVVSVGPPLDQRMGDVDHKHLYIDISSGARGLNCSHSPHLNPYSVYASNAGSGKSALMKLNLYSTLRFLRKNWLSHLGVLRRLHTNFCTPQTGIYSAFLEHIF